MKALDVGATPQREPRTSRPEAAVQQAAQEQDPATTAMYPACYRYLWPPGAVCSPAWRSDLSARAVAAALGLHGRNLNRRRAAEGTSSFALMREGRYQVARDLSANTAPPVAEIAATLVYANIGNFTRALNRWSGVTPTTWRQLGALRIAK